MLLDLGMLNQKYNLKIKGVIHVGAHFGLELKSYEQLGIKNMMFFEPMSYSFQKLKEHVGAKAILNNVALGNVIGKMEMYTETDNNGQSSSLLEPALHVLQYPRIKFNSKEIVKITKLDTFIEHKENFNFLNIDVQGYELEVLKGGARFLESIDYIMTEVNNAEVYKNCARIEELDKFLGETYNFKRVETFWAGVTWGDAFYVKQ